MIRATLDTNVLVSAYLGSPTCRGVIAAARDGRFQSVTSPYILGELVAVLTRPPLELSLEDAREYAAEFASVGEVHPVREGPPGAWTDRKDDAVVATAVVGNADVLVTGDKRLLAARVRDLDILTPTRFLERLG